MRRALVCAALAAVALSLAMPMGALAANKGTVKIDAVPFDILQDNEPHASCGFQVDFYNFDENKSVNWTFTVHPPTSDTSGPGSAVGGGSALLPVAGENGLNAGYFNDLEEALLASGIEPHEQQGFHIKLSVDTGDGPKYKVFWVECGGYPAQERTDETVDGDQTRALVDAGGPSFAVVGLFALASLLAVTLVRRRVRAAVHR